MPAGYAQPSFAPTPLAALSPADFLAAFGPVGKWNVQEVRLLASSLSRIVADFCVSRR